MAMGTSGYSVAKVGREREGNPGTRRTTSFVVSGNMGREELEKWGTGEDSPV